MVGLMTGQKLALYWILALVCETILALRTFKTRLATEGMPADRALVHASLWEAAHLFLLAVLIPGCFLFVTWRYLWRSPLDQWSIQRIGLAWLASVITFYLAMMVETVATETILPLDSGPIVQGAYGICIALAAAILAVTLKWLRNRVVQA